MLRGGVTRFPAAGFGFFTAAARFFGAAAARLGAATFFTLFFPAPVDFFGAAIFFFVATFFAGVGELAAFGFETSFTAAGFGLAGAASDFPTDLRFGCAGLSLATLRLAGFAETGFFLTPAPELTTFEVREAADFFLAGDFMRQRNSRVQR